MAASSSSPRPLSELAAHVGGEVVGDSTVSISGVNGLAEAGAAHVSFYANPRYRKELLTTQAGAVLVAGEIPEGVRTNWIRVDNPQLAFARISGLFHPRPAPAGGVSERACVHPSAKVHPSATVMALATVERGASVGAGTVLYPGVYVGENASIGEGCTLYPNVTVLERCQVGARVILHASCVVGADGFGFAFNPSVPEHFKIPQTGIVRIEDDVEIGAGTCLDRATIGETVVGRGTKIDNQVQIAHNVKVGPMSIICAQTGIAGSSELGTGVVLGGQVGLINHLKIGDMVKVGAKSAVMKDVESGAQISGYPAVDHREWLRSSVATGELAELVKEVRRLRQQVDKLEKERKS